MSSTQNISKEDSLSVDDVPYFSKSVHEDSSEASNLQPLSPKPVENIESRFGNPPIQSQFPITKQILKNSEFSEPTRNKYVCCDRKSCNKRTILSDMHPSHLINNIIEKTFFEKEHPETVDLVYPSSNPMQHLTLSTKNSFHIPSQSPFTTDSRNVPISDNSVKFKDLFFNKVPGDRERFFYRKDGDCSDRCIERDLSQNAYPESSDFVYRSSNPAQNLTSSIEKTYPILKQLISTRNVPISDGISYNDAFFHKVPEDRGNPNIERTPRLDKIAPILKSARTDGTYLHENVSGFASNASPNDISIEYRQLYETIPPEKFDFAMNVMAYIEFLNNPYWVSTYTYFDNDVKSMIKYYWNGSKEFINNLIEKQNFSRDLFMQLIADFSDSLKSKNFNICQLLNCFVMLCHLAVIARKHNYKEVPLHVIYRIRKIIQNLDCNQVTFTEETVKNYARDLVKCLKL